MGEGGATAERGEPLALGLAPPRRRTGRVEGRFEAPGSKSQAVRVLLAAALCDGETTVLGIPSGEDAACAVAAAEALARATEAAGPDEWVGPRAVPPHLWVAGRPPEAPDGWERRLSVQAGESATLARLATAALGLAGPPPAGPFRIEGRGSLARRRSLPLFRALAHAGVELRSPSGFGGWPVECLPARPPAEVALALPASSQEVSALLLALAAHPGVHRLRVRGEVPSPPYVDLTRKVLSVFGVETVAAGGGEEDARRGASFVVQGPLRAPSPPVVELEPDASLAAVALAAGCLTDGEVRVPGIADDSAQGDRRVVDHLAAFGCRARAERGSLVAAGHPTRGAEVDLAGEPDLAPVLAPVAAAAALATGERSVLAGLATLSHKESDRIATLARGLDRAGFEVAAAEGRLAIGPPRARAGSDAIVLDPAGDHRMAFAFALLGLVRYEVYVASPSCVNKTWPHFWRDMAALGASVRPFG